MPWIHVIDEPQAEGKLAEIYAGLRDTRGNVANIHRIHSLFPEALRAHMDLYRVLLYSNDAEISRADAELIATVVSIENSCDYCAAHHGDALSAQYADQPAACPIPSRDHTEWKLDGRQRAMLDFATKLAQIPHATSEEDVAALRTEGFTDRAILEIVMVTSYFCFVNRIALGLGVSLSAEERAGFRY